MLFGCAIANIDGYRGVIDWISHCVYNVCIVLLCKHYTVNQRSVLCALVKLHQHKHHVRGQQQEVGGGRRDDVALGARVTLTVTVPQSTQWQVKKR